MCRPPSDRSASLLLPVTCRSRCSCSAHWAFKTSPRRCSVKRARLSWSTVCQSSMSCPDDITAPRSSSVQQSHMRRESNSFPACVSINCERLGPQYMFDDVGSCSEFLFWSPSFLVSGLGKLIVPPTRTPVLVQALLLLSRLMVLPGRSWMLIVPCSPDAPTHWFPLGCGVNWKRLSCGEE